MTSSVWNAQELREHLRLQYRPREIRVLLIAESPPAGGTFFYAQNSNLAKYTEVAFRKAYELPGRIAMGDFLEAFKAAGCYLDDLCLEPVNHMGAASRRKAWKCGVSLLSERLAAVSPKPKTIIPVMIAIASHIGQAAETAGLSKVLKAAIPFPTHGNQQRYVQGLSKLLVTLRTASILPSKFECVS